MKRLPTLIAALGLALCGTAALAHPRAALIASPMAAQSTLTALAGTERSAAIASANRALNGLSRLEGRFLQIAGDGSATEGKFYIQRPGRLRFEYDRPSPLTIVADGRTVAIADRDLKTVDRVPLRSTPLFVVLKQNIDLTRDARVTRVAREGGATLITARDRAGEADGEITLVFDGPEFELKRWRIVDGQGAATELALQSTRVVERFDPALFVTPQGVDPTARPRDR